MEQRRSPVRPTEIVAVVLLLALIVALIFPALNVGKGPIDRVKCESQQREIAKSIGRYENAKSRYLSYSDPILMTTSFRGGDQREAMLQSWIVGVLEMLNKEQFDAIRGELGTRPTELKLFQCPANRREGKYINYVANCGRRDSVDPEPNTPPDWPSNGMFMRRTLSKGTLVGDSIRADDIIDGVAHTLLISENLQAMRWTDTDEASIGFVWFPEPNPEAPDPPSRRINVGRDVVLEESNYDYARPSSWHPDGVVVAYCDGRTEFMADTIDYRVYCHLMTPNGARAMEPGTTTPTVEMYRR